MALVQIPTMLRHLTQGRAEVEAGAGTLGEALARLGAGSTELLDRVREALEARSALQLFLNGTRLHGAEALEAVLHDADEVTLIPAIAGGR